RRTAVSDLRDLVERRLLRVSLSRRFDAVVGFEVRRRRIAVLVDPNDYSATPPDLVLHVGEGAPLERPLVQLHRHGTPQIVSEQLRLRPPTSTYPAAART